MEDPRITVLMERLDDLDEDGKSTVLAQLARRIRTYSLDVEKLRNDLKDYHEQNKGLESSAESLTASIEERESLRDDLTLDAQEAATQAAVSRTVARGAQLQETAAKKRSELDQFEVDIKKDRRRLKDASGALSGARESVIDSRNRIAQRLGVIDALLHRADIEWPAYFYEEAEAHRQRKQAAAAPTVVRRRPKRRLIIRRRR